MKKAVFNLFFCLLSLVLNSCHSTLAYGLTGTQEPFAGTQAIAIMGVPESPKHPASTGDSIAWYTFKVVDLPFTLVADCFWWPMSVYYNSEYEKQQKQELEKEKQTKGTSSNKI